MDEIKKRKAKFLITLSSGIFIGMIAGVAGLNALVSYKIDSCQQKIKHLEADIEDRDVHLKKLEESINKRKFILKDIEVVLHYEGDDLDKIALKKHITAKFSHLLGKEVRSIDIETVEQVIDKRIFKMDGKELKLRVNKIMLNEVLKIWITASPSE